MKKLSEEEKANYSTRPMKKQGAVRSYFMNMKVGDIVLIESREWHWKTKTPSYLCRRVEEDTGWKFTCEKVLSPNNGWIVTRTA